MSESDDRMELAARRKGYIRDGVYVKVEIDARVITEDLIKTWAPEDLEIIRDRIIKVINKDIKPSGDEKGGHRDAMTAAATTHTPGKTAPETPEGKKCQHCGKPVKLSDEHFVRMEDTMFDTSHWSCDEKPSTATPKSETLDGCTRCGHRNGEHTQFGHCKKCNCEDYTRSPYYRLASGDGKYPNCHHSPHTGMCRVTPNGGPDVCCCTKGHIDVDAGIADEIGKDLHLAPELSMGPCNDCIVVGGCSLSKYIEGTGMICDKKARLSQPTAAQATPEWKTCRDCVPPYGHCYVPCAKLRAEAEARLAAAEELVAAGMFPGPRIATLEAALRQRCDECPHDTDDKLCKHCLWYEYKHPSGDDSEKCYEEDRKTIESLLAQRDKLANEVNRLQTALDGAADLMIGGVEGPVQPPKSDLKPGEGRPIPRGEMMAKRLVDKFKEDFKMNFEQDDHICPDEMLKWLEDNA